MIDVDAFSIDGNLLLETISAGVTGMSDRSTFVFVDILSLE